MSELFVGEGRRNGLTLSGRRDIIGKSRVGKEATGMPLGPLLGLATGRVSVGHS